MTTNAELIEAIEDAGFEWRPYSGRGMYGKQCLGVTIDNLSDLFNLGAALNYYDQTIQAPQIDNMGRGYIAYWPSFKIDEDAAYPPPPHPLSSDQTRQLR